MLITGIGIILVSHENNCCIVQIVFIIIYNKWRVSHGQQSHSKEEIMCKGIEMVTCTECGVRLPKEDGFDNWDKVICDVCAKKRLGIIEVSNSDNNSK